MSAITINGAAVTVASITISMFGAWSADVTLPAGSTISSPATIVAGDLSIVGTVVRQGAYSNSTLARVVGGAAGWRKVLPVRGYSHAAGVLLSSVVGDAASEVGETVTISTDRSLGGHYAREGGQKAERILHLLVDGQWWIDNTGRTRLDARDASPIVMPFTVVSWMPSKGVFEIATESLSSWTPGRTFTASTVAGTQTISSVTIAASNEGKLRLTVLNTDGAVERLRTDMRAIARSEVPSINYAGVWEYTIASGTSSTVDVVPTDARMPSLTGVPMMPGLMGEVVTPTPGSKCRIAFVNMDPARPECIGIIGSPVKIEIAGPLPTQASARFGDAVSGTAITLGSTKVFIGG
jgi:hypothetical protein